MRSPDWPPFIEVPVTTYWDAQGRIVASIVGKESWVDTQTSREKFEALASNDPETRDFELMWLRRAAVAFNIFVERQRKYGPTNIARHGCMGVIVRLGDKLARLEHTYLEGHPMPPDESPVDAWIDTANYALIGWMAHSGEWPGVKPYVHRTAMSTPEWAGMEMPS